MELYCCKNKSGDAFTAIMKQTHWGGGLGSFVEQLYLFQRSLANHAPKIIIIKLQYIEGCGL